jgi:hypothetical protein
MSAACATSSAIPSSLAVAIPADCERILVPVPVPAVKAGDDLRAAMARGRIALRTANTTIVSGRECVAGQRKAYGGAR